MQAGFGLGLSSVALADSWAGTDGPSGAGLVWRRRTFNALGTPMTLRVAHATAGGADAAIAAAIRDVHTVEDQMSLLRSDSALRELNRTGVLRDPPPDLLFVLRTAQAVSQRSQGAFDVTVQPLWEVFDGARNQGRLPTPQEVTKARALTGWQDLRVDGHEVRLVREGMGVTLNGIAPGFAADKVQRTLRRLGVQQALIDTGEWSSLGQAPGRRDWTLGVANPRDAHSVIARVALRGRCVATSADDECTFSDDHVYNHIFNPHTGYSPTVFSSVTVIAPTCVMADAITKVIFMSDFASALPLAAAWGVEVLVVEKSGRWKSSKGLPVVRA